MTDALRTITDHNKTATFTDRGDYLEMRSNIGDFQILCIHGADISKKVGKPVKIVREFGNKRVEYKWATNGNNYNPFGGPSTVANGSELWTGPDGFLHRVGGPAAITRDGTHEGVEWKQNNRFHRDDGPAVIQTHFNKDWPRHCKFGDLPANFKVHDDHRALFGIHERVSLYASREQGFYRHGLLESINGGAALISENEVIESICVLEDGSIIRKTYCDMKSWGWFSENHEHRSTGPARVVMSNCYEEWKNDTLITRRCAGWDVEWWLHGIKLKNHDVSQWLSHHHILLIEPYRIEGSVWREQQDEFAFVMDFQVKAAAA